MRVFLKRAKVGYRKATYRLWDNPKVSVEGILEAY